MAAAKGPGGFVVLLAAAGAIAAHYGATAALHADEGWAFLVVPWLAPAPVAGLLVGCAQTVHRRDAFDAVPAGLGATLIAYLGIAGGQLFESAKGGLVGSLGMLSLVVGIWLATAPLLLLGALAVQWTAQLMRRRPTAKP